MWTGHLSTPQKPEQLALEIGALDSSKEQLLKEGEAWRMGMPCPALPCPAICLFLLQKSWWRQSWRM